MKETVTEARRRYRQAVRDAWSEADIRSDRPITPTRTIARRIARRTGLPVEVVTSGLHEDPPARRGRILREQEYRRMVAAGGDDLAVMLGVRSDN
jgi:hypothetical protein